MKGLLFFSLVVAGSVFSQPPLVFFGPAAQDVYACDGGDCNGGAGVCLGPSSGTYAEIGQFTFNTGSGVSARVYPPEEPVGNWMGASNSQIYICGGNFGGPNFLIMNANGSNTTPISSLTVPSGQVGVDSVGRYVYVLSGSTFYVIDPTVPLIIFTGPYNQTLGGVSFSTDSASKYAYLGSGNALIVIQNTAPSFSLQGTCTLPTGVQIQGVATTPNGEYVYVTCSDNTVRVINVSNPTSPTLVNTITSGNFNNPTAIVIANQQQNTFAYVANQGTDNNPGQNVIILNAAGTGAYNGFTPLGNTPVALAVAVDESTNFSYICVATVNNQNNTVFVISPNGIANSINEDLDCTCYSAVCALRAPSSVPLLFKSKPSRF